MPDPGSESGGRRASQSSKETAEADADAPGEEEDGCAAARRPSAGEDSESSNSEEEEEEDEDEDEAVKDTSSRSSGTAEQAHDATPALRPVADTKTSPPTVEDSAKSPVAAASAEAGNLLSVPELPLPVRRRSSLVPHELQQGGTAADVEAAKVRRAVAAAKKRVQKARAKPKPKQEKPKKKLTSRSELLASLFNALGGYETGYLGSEQLLRMAQLLGFDNGPEEWHSEYLALCRSYGWNEMRGANRRQFAELLDDEDSDAFSNDMELATMLCNFPGSQPHQILREHLVKAFFDWVDLNHNKRLGSREILRFAKHLGFDGSSAEWDKEYAYMLKRYGWNQKGCDLFQFNRLLADEAGLCYCDDAALQVELAELELVTCQPFFSRLLDQAIAKADADLRNRSAVLIQQLWRGRNKTKVLMLQLVKKLREKKEREAREQQLGRLRKAEAARLARKSLAAERLQCWWRTYLRKQKWLRLIAETKAKLQRDARRKEEMRSRRLESLSRLQDAEIRGEDTPGKPRLRASLVPKEARPLDRRILEAEQQRALQMKDKFVRLASPKFLEADRQPKDWKQVRIPDMDDWFNAVSGLVKKQGYRPDQEGDRFEVLNRKGVLLSLKEQRLLSRDGRRGLLSTDFPLLVNIKEWKISELRRRSCLSGAEERKSQVAIQKQIEQLKRGRPGKLLGAQERERLEKLREAEAQIQAQLRQAKAQAELLLHSRAARLLQAVIRGKCVRLELRKRHRAARALQRGWRGYLGRLRVIQLRELAEARVKQIKHVRNAESLFEAVHERHEAVAIRVVRDKDFNPFAFRHRVSQQSLLHAAAQEGLEALCGELVRAAKLRGIQGFASAKDWRGWTALHVAAQNGEARCLRELLQCEELLALPGCLGRNGQTALHVAALHGHTEAVKTLLSTQSFEEEVDRRDRWGRTALHCAAELGHTEAAVAIAEHPNFAAFHARTLWGVDASAMASEALRQRLAEAQTRRGEQEGQRMRRRICTFKPPDREEPEVPVGSRESVSSDRRRGVTGEVHVPSEVLQKAGLHVEARAQVGREVLSAKREATAKATASAREALRATMAKNKERRPPPMRGGTM